MNTDVPSGRLLTSVGAIHSSVSVCSRKVTLIVLGCASSAFTASAAGMRLMIRTSTSSSDRNRFFMYVPPETIKFCPPEPADRCSKTGRTTHPVQPCSFRFRRKCLQPSGILTHPPDGGFTVTDSRGLAPHFPCRPKRRRLRNMKNRIQCITVRRRCKSLCGHETGQKNLLPAVNGRRFFTCRKPHVGGVTGRRLLPETKEKKQK